MKDLEIDRGSVALGNWYEPMGIKVFRQIIDGFSGDPAQFEFVDFGSGKGRVLILAAEYGFKKVIGVEFARDLDVVVQKNIEIYERRIGRRSRIEAVCLDATEYAIPNTPVVLFFASPFTGVVMKRVVDNISASFRSHPRPMVVLFYGRNVESLEYLKKPER